MGDSVIVINEEKAKPYTVEVGLTIKRNTDHLEIMLAKDSIIADTGSKTAFTASIKAGKAHIAANA